MLAFAAEVTKTTKWQSFSGALAPETLRSVYRYLRRATRRNGQNLIKVMAENNRLKVLPDVLEQFIHLRAASEAIAEVEVISANQLSDEQLAGIVSAMENVCHAKLS